VHKGKKEARTIIRFPKASRFTNRAPQKGGETSKPSKENRDAEILSKEEEEGLKSQNQLTEEMNVKGNGQEGDSKLKGVYSL